MAYILIFMYKIDVMKNKKYIILLITLVIASSCASTKQAGERREAERSDRQNQVQKAFESGSYMINITKLFTNRYHGLDLVPDKNYIFIENGIARINLAYVGKSFSTRPISAINVRGKIEDIAITSKKNGSNFASMIVVGGGERFNLNIRISASGYCSININNGRLDNISYRGKIRTNS